MNQKIVVVGAGPAGLTCAWELLQAGYRNVVICEKDIQVGGISKTVRHNGNRIDIGGHRFFSKSNWVREWWEKFLPVHVEEDQTLSLKYQGKELQYPVESSSDNDGDNVMIVRNRLSRIYYNKRFFDYPLKLTPANLAKLGFKKTIMFALSYIRIHLCPIKPERSLEDFFINRFGRKLYLQFFKEYTEKVWGVPCSQISADWGAQRVKSLSILSAVVHAFKDMLGLNKGKKVQTSLIEQFIYPKFGPGQMWEVVAQAVEAAGGQILMQHDVVGINLEEENIKTVTIVDKNGKQTKLECDTLVSTMPVKELVEALNGDLPGEVRDVSGRLQYRDFITVGLLYKKDALREALADNWIYIQEPGVRVGRVQIFNNWSPWMVADDETVWLGLEYFCQEHDDLWTLSKEDMVNLAVSEMKKIGLVNTLDILDNIVVQVPKAYPGYFGDAYKEFDKVRNYLDSVDNLFLIGRNGMHRYNNMDHSMLTAKEAAEQIISGNVDKSKIWNINISDEYHEK